MDNRYRIRILGYYDNILDIIAGNIVILWLLLDIIGYDPNIMIIFHMLDTPDSIHIMIISLWLSKLVNITRVPRHYGDKSYRWGNKLN